MQGTALRLRLAIDYLHTGHVRRAIGKSDVIDLGDGCPICDARVSDFITIRNHADESIVAKFVCTSCGYSSFNRMPNTKWFDEYYSAAWKQSDPKSESACSDMVETLLPLIPSRDARILDVGTGFGASLQRLKEHGFSNVFGVEASERSWRIARSKGLAVARGGVDTMTSVPEVVAQAPYDVIMMRQVLEHFYDVNNAIKQASTLLKEGGLLFVAVPNFAHEHIFGVAHYLPHIRNFSPYNLAHLLTKHGFKVVHLGDEIRTVGVKGGAGAAVAVAPPREVGTWLQRKLGNELGLELDPAAAPQYVAGAGALGARRSLRTIPFASMSIGKRGAWRLKRLLVGSGRNNRSVRSVAGLLSARDVSVRLLQAASPTASFEFSGTLEARTSPADAAGTAPCTIDFIYPEPYVKGWLR